jgi:hypothetical protein
MILFLIDWLKILLTTILTPGNRKGGKAGAKYAPRRIVKKGGTADQNVCKAGLSAGGWIVAVEGSFSVRLLRGPERYKAF